MSAFKTWLTGLTSKTTPVDADETYLRDSVTGNSYKLTWANLKATLKTYLDTLYQATLVSGTNIKTVNSTSILGSGDLTVSATPGGSTTQVQFNDAGAFGGDAGLTFNKTTKTLTMLNGVDTLTIRPTGSYQCEISGTYGVIFPGGSNGFTGNAHSNLTDGMGVGKDGLYWGRAGGTSKYLRFRDNSDDSASAVLSITGQSAAPSAVTYLVGGAINITGGAGASGSAGAANGGAVNLNGGAGYGAGTKGAVNASRLNAAGFATAITAKTANYTATADDGSIEVDATSGAVTITLPAVSGTAGRIYTIKKTDASGNAVTVDPNASETIDGATTASLASQYSTITIQANAAGTAWHKVSGI